MTVADAIREHVLEHYVEPARRRRESAVTVVAGDIHRDLALVDRVPSVCSALRSKKFLKDNELDLIKEDGPRSKQSTTTTFTYRLPASSETGHPQPVRNAIRDLRGIGKDMFAALGGGERWLGNERKAFDASLAGDVRRRRDDES